MTSLHAQENLMFFQNQKPSRVQRVAFGTSNQNLQNMQPSNGQKKSKSRQNAPFSVLADANPKNAQPSKQNASSKRKRDPQELEQKRRKKRRIPKPFAMEVESEIEVIEIDRLDHDDVMQVTEYVGEVMAYMRGREVKGMVSHLYMRDQMEVTEKMRTILVDWLMEVHALFKLIPETLFLTCGVLDRYLAKESVKKEDLQLVGITSMFIASKYEEIYAPEINDFVYITDNAYSREDMLGKEQEILRVLNFDLANIFPLHFLRRFSKAAGSTYEVHTLCKFMIEASLLNIRMLKYRPSMIAASAVYLARQMTGEYPSWTPTLEHYTTFSTSDISACVLDINNLIQKLQTSKINAVRTKYSEVSSIPCVAVSF